MFHDYRNGPPGNLSLPPALTALLQIFSMFLGISPRYCAFKILAVPQPSDAISELLQVVAPLARTLHAARAAAAVALWPWAAPPVDFPGEGKLCLSGRRGARGRQSSALLRKEQGWLLCPGSVVLLPTDAAAGQPPQEGELFWCGAVGAAVLRCLCGRGGARAAIRPFLTASPLVRPADTAGCWSRCSTVLLPAAPWGCSEAVKETRFRGSSRCCLLFLLFPFLSLNPFFACSHACHRRGLSEAVLFGQPLRKPEAKRKRELAVAPVQGRALGQAAGAPGPAVATALPGVSREPSWSPNRRARQRPSFVSAGARATARWAASSLMRRVTSACERVWWAKCSGGSTEAAQCLAKAFLGWCVSRGCYGWVEAIKHLGF